MLNRTVRTRFVFGKSSSLWSETCYAYWRAPWFSLVNTDTSQSSTSSLAINGSLNVPIRCSLTILSFNNTQSEHLPASLNKPQINRHCSQMNDFNVSTGSLLITAADVLRGSTLVKDTGHGWWWRHNKWNRAIPQRCVQCTQDNTWYKDNKQSTNAVPRCHITTPVTRAFKQ
jgi:hypothetical protein